MEYHFLISNVETVLFDGLLGPFFVIEPKFVRGHKPLIVTVAFLAYSTKAERGKIHTRKD